MLLLDLIKLAATIQRLYPFWKRGMSDVRAIQERRLRGLLAHASEHSPYYRRRFSGIDVSRCALSDLPVLTKAEMMENFDEIVTDSRIKRAEIQKYVSVPQNLGKLYLGAYGVSHTSGSQGQPAIIIQDQEALILTFAVRMTRGKKLSRGRLSNIHYLWRPARIAVVTFSPGFQPSSSAFAYRPTVLSRFSKILQLSITDPMPETIAKLEAFRPEYIVGYASALTSLAREEAAGHLNLRKICSLTQISNVAEPLAEPTAEYIERVFGVHVYNEYSMGECLALASGCSVTHCAHQNADLAILEVVDENNMPVPPGRQGKKVLLTNLYNTVQPIIRYEIDDRVTFGVEPCACGNVLPRIASIEGRSKDHAWISLKDEVRELPYYIFLSALHNQWDIAEHQVVQTGINKFLLRVAPMRGKELDPELLRSIVRDGLVAGGFDVPIDLTVEIVPAIECGPSGKLSHMRNDWGPPPLQKSQALHSGRDPSDKEN